MAISIGSSTLSSAFRYIVGPIIWRATILGLAIWKAEFLVGKLPINLESSDALSTMGGMFYAIAGVLGVLAGFIITALTIVATSDSDSVRRMKVSAPSSLPKKLLYAVLTLLFLALLTALLGPFSTSPIAISLLIGSILISGIEVTTVAAVVYIAISPRKRALPSAFTADLAK